MPTCMAKACALKLGSNREYSNPVFSDDKINKKIKNILFWTISNIKYKKYRYADLFTLLVLILHVDHEFNGEK